MKALILTALMFLAATVSYSQDENYFTFDTIYRSNPGPLTTRVDQNRDTQRQEETAPVMRRERTGHWVFGGSFGLGFSNRYTNINVSPQIGYSFNRYFTFGGGVSYNYYDSKRWDYSLNYLGVNVYGRAFPVRYFSLYAQPELQRRWGRIGNTTSDSEVFACLLLGGGLVIPMGYRAGLLVTVIMT